MDFDVPLRDERAVLQGVCMHAKAEETDSPICGSAHNHSNYHLQVAV